MRYLVLAIPETTDEVNTSIEAESAALLIAPSPVLVHAERIVELPLYTSEISLVAVWSRSTEGEKLKSGIGSMRIALEE
ncbi:MAG TPA: hypothetical protein VGR71_16795 [Nitrospira sp.]|nr:hypothetical protein [Nitrospira sp.]